MSTWLTPAWIAAVDRRRIAGEQSLVDVVAGELRRLDQVTEVDEQFRAQARILRHRCPVVADQRPIPGAAFDHDLAGVGKEPFVARISCRRTEKSGLLTFISVQTAIDPSLEYAMSAGVPVALPRSRRRSFGRRCQTLRRK